MCKVGLKSLRREFSTDVLEGKPVSLATVRMPRQKPLFGIWRGSVVSLSLHLTSSSDILKFNKFIEVPEVSPF